MTHENTAVRQLVRAVIQNLIPGGTLASMDVEVVETDGQARHTWNGSAMALSDRIAAAFPARRSDTDAARDVETAVREQGALPVPAGDGPTFFRPGRTYLRNLPFRAPEDLPAFECVGVGVHPSKEGALRAFGFERPGTGNPWVSASQRMEEWEEGWIDVGPTTPDRMTRTFAPTQVLRAEGAEEVPALAAYRAYDGAIPLGTYTTPAAARAHCEAHARGKWPIDSPTVWISDPDGGGDLVRGDVECPTGYVVTALEVAVEYDPDGNE